MSPVKLYKPTTPARRHASVIDSRQLAEPGVKRLRKGKSSTGGRGGYGRIATRHRGGGAKRAFRQIDFLQDKAVPAVVTQLEYDPLRTAFIALITYVDGEKRYILAEGSMKPQAKIFTGVEAPIAVGNRLPLRRIPSGTRVFNVQLAPDRPASMVRSAGSSASVVSHEETYTQVRLPSGEVRRILSDCLATIGVCSNREHENVRIGKAGRNRHRGIRPHVRGKAMNPVDHPHGGGEGANPIGLKGPKTPSGLYTLGRKTRRKRKVTPGVVRARN